MTNNLKTVFLMITTFWGISLSAQNYSNGTKFKVLRYVYTDLNDNIVSRNDNVKQTTFLIDSKRKLFTVKMGNIYNEYYYYNKVNRTTVDGKTRDVYVIYKSYNTENPNQKLTDVLILEMKPSSNALTSYTLFFGNKGFITFYLSPTK